MASNDLQGIAKHMRSKVHESNVNYIMQVRLAEPTQEFRDRVKELADVVREHFPFMSLLSFNTQALCSCLRQFTLIDHAKPSLLKANLESHVSSKSHKDKLEEDARRNGGVKRKTVTLEETLKNMKQARLDFRQRPEDNVGA